MIPNSYKVLSSCENCHHVFVRSDYDEGDTYFCTVDGSKRPLCCSTSMKEDFNDVFPDLDVITEEIHKKAMEFYSNWRDWSLSHEVKSNGICDKYTRKQD